MARKKKDLGVVQGPIKADGLLYFHPTDLHRLNSHQRAIHLAAAELENEQLRCDVLELQQREALRRARRKVTERRRELTKHSKNLHSLQLEIEFVYPFHLSAITYDDTTGLITEQENTNNG